MSFDDAAWDSGDFRDFDELPSFEEPERTPRELLSVALGDLGVVAVLLLVAIGAGWWSRTAGGTVAGVALAFSIYLGLMVIIGGRMAIRDLLNARRLERVGPAAAVASSGQLPYLERLIAGAERDPGNLLAQFRAAYQAWQERDFERAGTYAQRADALQPDLHRMLLILMAVHWYRGEPRQAQDYARRLLRVPSRAKAYTRMWVFLTWPLLLLPGVRIRGRWMRRIQEAEAAWVAWARWLVEKYDSTAGDEADSKAR